MRLSELDGHFLYPSRGSADDGPGALEGAWGVLYQCPKCAEGKERGEEDGRAFVRGAHYIKIYFANPIGASVADSSVDHNPRWTMSGTCLDDLTLTPSINLDIPGNEGGCRWHGFVTNGEAT